MNPFLCALLAALGLSACDTPPAPPPTPTPATAAVFVMSDPQGVIFTLDANGQNRHDVGNGFTPAWTPDSNIVPDGNVLHSTGNEIHQLTGFIDHVLVSGAAANVMFPQVGGRKLVFTGSDVPGNGITDVWIANADGSAPHKIIPHAGPASISPDGSWIAYTVESGTPFHREVWRAQADGSQPYPLTTTGDQDYPDANAPSISPDGKWVAIFSGREATNRPGEPDNPASWGYRNVAVVPAIGGPRRTITHCVPLSVSQTAPCIAGDNPAWSPDSRSILYDRGSPDPAQSGTWIIGLDGSGDHKLWPQARGGGRVPWR